MSTPTNSAAVAERSALVKGAAACAIIGCVGVTAAAFSGSQAILLDGLFNLAFFAMGLFTLRVARLVQRGDDAAFPLGYVFFEPLVNGMKGVLVLGVSVLAAWDAAVALLSGGRAIAAGLAVGYGLFATITCWLVAYVAWRAAKQSRSPLVEADTKNWLVNAAISSCVLLTFATIFLIRGTALRGLVPYIDPGLVLVVVAVSIGVPVRMAWQALMALLNRTPSPVLAEQVAAAIRQTTGDLPVRDLWVRVIQPGRVRFVAAHVVLAEDYKPDGLAALDDVRRATEARLRQDHAATIVDLIFTADRKLGMPGGQQADTT